MNIGLAKLGHKGRVVIPIELRQGLKKGDSLLVTRQGDQVILRKVTDIKSVIMAGLSRSGKK